MAEAPASFCLGVRFDRCPVGRDDARRSEQDAEGPIMSIRTEVVELAHLAKEAGLAYWEEFEKIYGGWTIEWDPQSDARLEGLATKMQEAEQAFWQAKSELDPSDQSVDPSAE
jgi:hypothetical protein